VLVLGLSLCVAMAAWVQHTVRQQQQTALEVQVQRLALALDNRLTAYIDLLPGLRLFSNLGQTGQDAAFANFIDTIALPRRYPGLALTFVADRVSPAQAGDYIARVQADRSLTPLGHPDFHITPLVARPGRDGPAPQPTARPGQLWLQPV
jgi:CHASE1-domain containing sensor protein